MISSCSLLCFFHFCNEHRMLREESLDNNASSNINRNKSKSPWSHKTLPKKYSQWRSLRFWIKILLHMILLGPILRWVRSLLISLSLKSCESRRTIERLLLKQLLQEEMLTRYSYESKWKLKMYFRQLNPRSMLPEAASYMYSLSKYFDAFMNWWLFNRNCFLIFGIHHKKQLISH